MSSSAGSTTAPTALAIHAGAGSVVRGRFPRDAAAEAALRHGLNAALALGGAVLSAGGSALDAVVAAVTRLEDEPLFNAGRGSVLARDGRVEMDACVMEGRARRAGAVACVGRVANPIELARRVMDETPHVLMVAEGAERLAQDLGMALIDPEDLVVEARRRQLERALARGAITRDHDDGSRGTVGCVARDATGSLAAATSTGGMVAKRPGRVGDSPVPGAGTWACDSGCAVSGTGDGEGFLRVALAHEVDAAMRLGGRSLPDACDVALERVRALGFTGGCIAVAPTGPPRLRFNTPGMLRGVLGEDGEPQTALFGDEILPGEGQSDTAETRPAG